MRVVPAAVLVTALTTLTGCVPFQLVRSGDAPADAQSASIDLPRNPAQTPPPDEANAGPAPTAEDALTAAALPPPPEDIWQRLRAGYALPHSNHQRVEQSVRYFAGHPAYVQRVAQRAAPYLHYILEAVQSRGMPAEIALLPVVESAYRPFAYSPGRAAGLWQFVPGTARHFGLKQNWWYDGRRDVVASTKAALTYLDRLHGMFGDWLLALAAYNAGEGTVQAAVRRNERRGEPTDFWHLDLPAETRGYVPRLLAVRDLFERPDHYGVALPDVPDKPYLDVVDVGSQIDLALAAKLADMSMQEIYQFNPGYNRWATAPNGPHRLILPLANAEHLRSGLEELPKDKRIQWRRHRVSSGESLISIAKKYRTTVSMLKDVNGMHGSMIRAGQHLIIPIASEPLSHYALSQGQRKAALRSRNRHGQKHIYRVRPGDSFWDIARRFDVSVAKLTKWNGMAPGDILRPGQKLVVWTRGGTVAAASYTGPANRKQSVHYTVRQGDSLYRIAQRFNVSVESLRRWNDLTKGRYLQPGQRLHMEVDVTEQAGI